MGRKMSVSLYEDAFGGRRLKESGQHKAKPPRDF
jgi:hypothetical protein